jgi:hypothetical protein
MFSFLIGLALCANAANAKEYYNPSKLNGVKISYVHNVKPDWTIPEKNTIKNANNVIQDIKDFGDIFRKYNNTIIKREICDKQAEAEIDMRCNTYKLANVSPGYEQDIIDVYLDGVCETLGKENMTAYDDCKKQMATMPYISDGYWDHDNIYFDNVETNYSKHIKVWKSLNDDDSSNWLITQASDIMHIAPNTLMITNNHCSSSNCSSHKYINQNPQNLTNTDIWVLNTFFNAFMVRKELEALDIQDKVNMTQLMWSREYC